MNTYKQLKDRQQKEMDAFPLGAAFSKQQFADMMQEWGFTVDDTDKIISIGAGCFIRKSDKEAFFNMLKRHDKEMQDAIAEDKTGDGFIYDMFYYELANHEYIYIKLVFFYSLEYRKSPDKNISF
jgi:hypothetical protein